MGKILTAAMLLSTAAWGQDVQRTYNFVHISSAVGYKEIANVYRTIGDLKDVWVDEAAATLSTHGAADQMALADWLFPQIDVQSTPASVSHWYQATGKDPVVRVFYLAHTPNARAAQEIVNMVRSGADCGRIIVAWESRTVTVRATADQAAVAAWLFTQLDLSAPTPGTPTESYHFPVSWDPEIHIVHLAAATQPYAIQELVNGIRVVADMNRVFPAISQGILMLRGTDDSVATAEWMVSQLNLPPTQQGPAPHQRQTADNTASIVRVFHLSHPGTPESAQEIVRAIRDSARIQRIWTCTQVPAVVVRGTADQVAQAAILVAKMDR